MEENKKINLFKNEENFFSNSFKMHPKKQSNIALKENKINLSDITIFFDFENKKKKEIGFEDENDKNKKTKNLIQMLKVKINQALKNEITHIGCGGYFSFIYDNSFNFF
jgi:hypothetical protein